MRRTSAGSVAEIIRIPASLSAPTWVALDVMVASRSAWAISSAAAAAISDSVSSAARLPAVSSPPWTDRTPKRVSPAISGRAA